MKEREWRAGEVVDVRIGEWVPVRGVVARVDGQAAVITVTDDPNGMFKPYEQFACVTSRLTPIQEEALAS